MFLSLAATSSRVVSSAPTFWEWGVVLVSIVLGLIVLALAWRWERRGLGRGALVLVLLIGVACRLAVMSSSWELSDDAARYHWDGKVLAHAVNPYLYAPVDPRLDRLREHALDRQVNHPELHTVYPPLAQCLFTIAYRLSPGGLGGFHVLTLLAEIVTWLVLAVALERRGLPHSRLVLLAWLPLLIFEGYLPGHLDLLGLPFVALFVLNVQGARPKWAGVFLALACLIKPLPLIFLPAAMRQLGPRRGTLLLLTAMSTVALFYVPFLGAGHWLFDSMWVMATRWSFNGSLAALVETVMPAGLAHLTLAILLAVLVFVATFRGTDLLNRCLLAFAAFVVCTSTLYPWYLVWILPLLVLRPEPALLALVLMAPLADLVLVEFQATGFWRLPLWVSLMEYVPFYALLIVGAVRGRGTFGRVTER